MDSERNVNGNVRGNDRREGRSKNSRLYKIRRLYRDSRRDILKIYSGFDRTFFNPVSREFIDRCTIDGEFWGVFRDMELVSCVYYMPARCAAFGRFNAAWERRDLLGDDMGNWAVCGHIAPADKAEDDGIYTAFLKLAKVYGQRIGARNIIYYTPVKLYCPWRQLFENGFVLKGLRGLDNAVANYIFTGRALLNYGGQREYTRDLKCRLSDTKGLSMALEHGYVGHSMNENNEIILGR